MSEPVTRTARSDRFWALLIKWQERLKVLIWFITSFAGGVTAAWYAIDRYLNTKVEERIQKIKAYEGNSQTKIINAQGADIFRVQCSTGDIPLSFTFSANINDADPILRSSSKIGNGFELDIANGAGHPKPPAPITVTPQCLTTGQSH